jgi:PDZ domain
MRRLLIWFLGLFLMLPGGVRLVHAQLGFELKHGFSAIEIPFEYVNNFIIVEMYINAVYPYKLIFDTGAEHTILTRKDFMSFPNMTFERTFYLIGSDQKMIIPAHLVRGVRMDLPSKAASEKEDVLMLDDDVFAFEEYTGVQVDGILSASVFDQFVFRINYQRKVITLFERKVYRPPSGRRAERVPLQVHRQKPYFYACVQANQNDTPMSVKLLADTGAGTALVLFTDSTIVAPVQAVPGNFAMGIGGNLEGYIGRLHELQIERFSQKQAITHYQKVDSLEFKGYLNNRNGLVGNQIWSRFIVDFDYTNQVMWLQPSAYFNKPYVYDRSGLSIIAGGKALSHFYVHLIQPSSPAAEAGVLAGDRILSINRVNATFLNMDQVLRMLRSNRKKPVRLHIKRGQQRMILYLSLRDLI